MNMIISKLFITPIVFLGDSNVQQIVNDIQRTLYRINPNIISDENVIFPKDQIGDIKLPSKFKRESEKVKIIQLNIKSNLFAYMN